MAATAAAAVTSSFTASMQSLNCIRFKNWPCDPALKVVSSRMLQVASISHSLGIESSILIGPLSNKWRASRIAAAVAQEEAAVLAPEEATAPEQVEEVIQEEKEVEEVSSEAEVAQSSSVNTKLYFGNLPYNVDSAQLAGVIQDYASPELIEVLYDRETGRSRGFAFVTMSTVEDCNVVIQNLDGREYGGRNFRVNFSDKPRPKDPLYPETEHKLFVGNLAWSVTSESLTEAFQEYGNVVGARVLYDGDTGRSRGYGFVCYETRAEMDAALNSLNGVELEGRPMRVSLAQGKKH
ncbi:28 kDa ribonucleoprotein, chloroplastic-like [Coffea arabica]|uniref:28 kDa ribonucleoprotein, chloroplastic-like n=1 Tax=Coffea arabica TaxID=13443 RepID=A0A6P6WZJ1_COFAR|nr:30S ribosomal protein 2, chloroplastic-like [Coffea arabica]